MVNTSECSKENQELRVLLEGIEAYEIENVLKEIDPRLRDHEAIC